MFKSAATDIITDIKRLYLRASNTLIVFTSFVFEIVDFLEKQLNSLLMQFLL